MAPLNPVHRNCRSKFWVKMSFVQTSLVVIIKLIKMPSCHNDQVLIRLQPSVPQRSLSLLETRVSSMCPIISLFSSSPAFCHPHSLHCPHPHHHHQLILFILVIDMAKYLTTVIITILAPLSSPSFSSPSPSSSPSSSWSSSVSISATATMVGEEFYARSQIWTSASIDPAHSLLM